VAQRRRVLLVWNDRQAAAQTTDVLARAGFDVRIEQDSFAGMVAAETWSPDVIVLNWEQPLVMGAIFRAALAASLDAMPPVVALAEAEHVAEVDATVAAVLPKPLDGVQLMHWITRVLTAAVCALPMAIVSTLTTRTT
jgi:DNA-binding response OmpR family regulator